MRQKFVSFLELELNVPAWLISLAAYKWGILYVPLGAFLVWVVSEAFFYRASSSHLTSIGFPQTGRWRFSLRVRFARLQDFRFIVGAAVSRRMHWNLFLISFLLLVIAGIRAMATRQSAEFSRAGGLLVIAGLVSAYFSIREASYIRELWKIVRSTSTAEIGEAIEKRMQRPSEEAQLFAAGLALIISLIGTLVWAYGDQIFSCITPSWFSDVSTICKAAEHQ